MSNKQALGGMNLTFSARLSSITVAGRDLKACRPGFLYQNYVALSSLMIPRKL